MLSTGLKDGFHNPTPVNHFDFSSTCLLNCTNSRLRVILPRHILLSCLQYPLPSCSLENSIWSFKTKLEYYLFWEALFSFYQEVGCFLPRIPLTNLPSTLMSTTAHIRLHYNCSCTLEWELSGKGVSLFGTCKLTTKCRAWYINSKVAQLCLTLCNPMDCIVHGILQARILEWVPFPFSRDLPNPGIKPKPPALWADSLPAEPQGKPKNTGVGSLSLLQRIFLTQELNQGLLHCKWILYQLSYL